MRNKNYFKELDITNTSTCKKRVLQYLMWCRDFMVFGDAIDFIKEHSKNAGYETVVTILKNTEDLVGKRILKRTKEGMEYVTYFLPLQDQLRQNPEKQFLWIFIVDEAETSIINKLKSIIEQHDINGLIYENFFVCVICCDKNIEINSTINDLLKPIIRWE